MELLTQLIVLGLLSYPASFVMNFIIATRLVKDVADQGYKLDLDRIKELTESLNIDSPLTRFKNVPILNIGASLAAGYLYKREMGKALLSLNVLDCLEEMTKEEKEMYEKNPTGLNAMKIMSLSYDKNKKFEKLEEVKEKYKDKYEINYDYDIKENTYNLDVKHKENAEEATAEDNYEVAKEIAEALRTRQDKPKTRSRIKKQ